MFGSGIIHVSVNVCTVYIVIISVLFAIDLSSGTQAADTYTSKTRQKVATELKDLLSKVATTDVMMPLQRRTCRMYPEFHFIEIKKIYYLASYLIFTL